MKLKLLPLLSWIFGFSLIGILWIVGNYFTPTKVPPIIKIFTLIKDNWDLHFANSLQTGKEAFLGLVISIFLTSLVLFLIGVYSKFEFVITPIVVFLKASPAVAFVPIFMIFFGTGIWCKVAISTMICFFPLIIGGLDGLKRTPTALINYSSIYGTNKINKLLYIKLGYLVEGFLSGLKTSAPLSVIGAIVGEYVVGGQQLGLGGFIISSVTNYSLESRYIGIVLASSLGLTFYLSAFLIHNFYERKLYITN